MRGARKNRDEAIERILTLLAGHPGTRFRTSYLASTLQLGRERINGLLRDLHSEGRVVCDEKGWYTPLTNGQLLPSPKETVELPSGPTWVMRITIAFEAKP